MIRPEEIAELEKAANRVARDFFLTRSFFVPIIPIDAETTTLNEAQVSTIYAAILRHLAEAWIDGFCRGRDGKAWLKRLDDELARRENYRQSERGKVDRV